MRQTPKGVSYMTPVEIARRVGHVECNQYDQRPSAIRFRRAIYRAVKRGLLKRHKQSKPSRMIYTPVSPQGATVKET